jgi:O-antigen ligase
MNHTNFTITQDIVKVARWLVILELIALLISPPLTNLFELTLFGLFIFNPQLRDRFMTAMSQPMVKATLLFYLILLIDTTYSIESWKESLGSFWGWRKIMILPISVALFDETAWKDKLGIIFAKALTFAALLSYVSKFLQFQVHHSYPIGIIIRNHATQGIMFSIAAFCFALLLTFKTETLTKVQKWFYSLSVLILVSNVVYITPGRSGYLALVVLSLTLLLTYMYMQKKFIVPLLVIALIPLILLSSANVKQRVSQGVNEAEQFQTKAEATSMGIRMVLWNNTIKLIKERPLFGYGTGAFEKAYTPKVENEPKWKQDIKHDPHNQYLKIATEQGLVGLAFFLWMIFSFFKQDVDTTHRLLGIGVLLVWCGNSLFSSHFSTFSEGRFIFLWCGVMLANKLFIKNMPAIKT